MGSSISIPGRWFISPAGLFTTIGAVHELCTRPNRDVLVETMGVYVNLHSIYLGLLGTGAVLVVPGALSVWQWWSSTHRVAARFLRLGLKLATMASLEVYDIADVQDTRFAFAKFGIDYPLDGIDARLR